MLNVHLEAHLEILLTQGKEQGVMIVLQDKNLYNYSHKRYITSTQDELFIIEKGRRRRWAWRKRTRRPPEFCT